MFQLIRVQLVRMPQREVTDGIVSIVVACDDAFAQHTYVTIASLLQTNPVTNFDVYVLVPPDFSFSSELTELQGARCTIRLIAIDPASIDSLFVSKHISVAAYYRLLMDVGLPAGLRRVLYLDSDIIIAGTIAHIWTADLGDCIIGAVPDINDATAMKRKLGLGEDLMYFNSGVMLIDLDRWREFGTGLKTLEYCRDHEDRLTYWDQCALNYVLAGKVQPLDWIWNFQTSHLQRLDSNRTQATFKLAKIVHFTTRFKPWMYRCTHPFAYRYWEILAETPWRGYRPPDRTAMNVLKRALRRRLPRPVLRLLGTDKVSRTKVFAEG